MKNLFRFSTHLILIICFCLLSSACQKKERKITRNEAPKTLHLNFTRDIPTVDPRRCSDPVSSTMLFMLFQGLTKHSSHSSTDFGVSDHFDISDDQCTYTFHIRETYWSNGERVTAHDFEKSWKDMLTPSFPAPNAQLLYPIKNAQKAKQGLVDIRDVGISAISDDLLVIELEQATPYFLEVTSFCALFPCYHPRGFDENYRAELLTNEIVTNGPFKIKESRVRDQITLVKNPYFYDASRIHLDEIKISFVLHDMTAFNLFEQNNLDIIGLYFSNIPREALHDLRQKKLIHQKPIAATCHFSFNLEHHLFNNLNFRRAFHHAIDRASIIENITGLDEQIAHGLIPPIQKRMQEMAPSQDVFDPQLANRYLTQALEELNLDKNHLPTIVLTHINSEIDRKIAQAVQEQIRSTLNIDVKLEELDFGYFLETTSKKKHQIALCYAIAQYNDPIDFLSRYTSKTHFKNYSNWSSQSFADLIEQSKSIYDFNERMKLYQQAEDIFMEDLPISPLYHFNVVFLINPQIKNFYISPIGSVHIDFIDFIPSPVL